ncbi:MULTISPECIES: ABC transporter permease [Rhodococcus]|uniref:ABC transporter permease n=1 Tax=Rhodococcus TaxID=1827 RepID=UPI0002A4510C|nr:MULTISPECIES: ABC transporter permease [Rhodococcus]ELB91819.1 ABC transporter permease [Rhodococcus wratislaviensis IFP 2016]MDI9939650.1 ABC transporter permease [Rhodococcus sp. IEGM 1351]MDX5967471.1 ABC transporter permease [Rhodococcus opacus]QZS58886.1 ABC transporter permease [Rhodococcus opacus]RKM74534.1 ABC transporter permease [Rhodococcus opacus]
MSATQEQQLPQKSGNESTGGRRWTPTWNGTSSVIAITVALFLFSWLIAPGSISGSAIDSLLPFAGILAIAAIGQTIVVMLKGIDLSLPGMMTLAALVSSQYAQDHGSILAALLVVAAIAVVVGLVNGIVVSAFSVTPLVATLAVNAVLMGAALAYSGGTPTRAPQSVSDFALEKTVGVSNTVWLAVLLMIVTVFATGRTAWGRRVVAVGSNERTARAAGVRTSRVKISGYVAAALCYSGAGVLLAGYVSTPNTNAGTSYLLPAIAAVVVGGTALTGGRGNIIGTAVGALFLSQLTQLVLSLGAPSSTQFLVQAVVIAVAVGAQQLDLRHVIQRLTPRKESA